MSSGIYWSEVPGVISRSVLRTPVFYVVLVVHSLDDCSGGSVAVGLLCVCEWCRGWLEEKLEGGREVKGEKGDQ